MALVTSRDSLAGLVAMYGAQRLDLIRHLPVVDVERNATIPLSEAAP